MTQHGGDFEHDKDRQPANPPREALFDDMTRAREDLTREVRWNGAINGKITIANAKLWSTGGVKLKNLRSGQKVQIIGQKGDGYLAKLEDGREGLIAQTAVELEEPLPAPIAVEETEQQRSIRSLLLAMGSLPVTDQTQEEIGVLKDPLEVGLRVAYRHNLALFSRARDIAAAPRMKKVPEITPYCRLIGVGMIDNKRTDNDERYAYCLEHTEQVIREITERLNTDLRTAGFPDSLWVRPIIRGLSRSAVFQNALVQSNPWAAEGRSPHQFGHTFDLHRNRYDIVDAEGNFVTSTISADDPLNNELRLSTKINATLGRLLIAMKEEGKISVIHEGRNAIYHISDLHPAGESATVSYFP